MFHPPIDEAIRSKIVAALFDMRLRPRRSVNPTYKYDSHGKSLDRPEKIQQSDLPDPVAAEIPSVGVGDDVSNRLRRAGFELYSAGLVLDESSTKAFKRRRIETTENDAAPAKTSLVDLAGAKLFRLEECAKVLRRGLVELDLLRDGHALRLNAVQDLRAQGRSVKLVRKGDPDDSLHSRRRRALRRPFVGLVENEHYELVADDSLASIFPFADELDAQDEFVSLLVVVDELHACAFRSKYDGRLSQFFRLLVRAFDDASVYVPAFSRVSLRLCREDPVGKDDEVARRVGLAILRELLTAKRLPSDQFVNDVLG